QGIEIRASRPAVFDFVCDPHNLPKWARAFQQANDKCASLKTPTGAVDIDLRTISHKAAGTIDWELRFPDGSIGVAKSRVTGTARRWRRSYEQFNPTSMPWLSECSGTARMRKTRPRRSSCESSLSFLALISAAA